MARWTSRVAGWFRRGGPDPLDDARTDLVVVVACSDDAEASSAALARSPGFVEGAQVVLRHHLELPPAALERATGVAAQDGYHPPPPGSPDLPEPVRDGRAVLTLQRVQVLDALHCSQERSRMAGLAQRLDGDVLGWDVLAPREPAAGG